MEDSFEAEQNVENLNEDAQLMKMRVKDKKMTFWLKHIQIRKSQMKMRCNSEMEM